jgi:hypothetical protein
MNGVMEALAERLAAVWIERIAGSKITTFAGILGILATAASQSTKFVPAAYSGYVAIAGVMLAGIAAILARDSKTSPVATQTATGSVAKLGCVALIALLITGTLPVMGCSGSQVAQDIVNWTPTLQSAVATVDTSIALLAPIDAPILAAATVGFDAASNLLVAQAKAYLANPNASLLAQLQTAVVTFEQQVNAALLSAARITNPASQQHALTAIGGVGTVINVILGLVQSISNKAQIAQMAADSTIKLAMVGPYLDRSMGIRMVAQHYGISELNASVDVNGELVTLQAEGF